MITIVFKCDFDENGTPTKELVGHIGEDDNKSINSIVNQLIKSDRFHVGPDGVFYPIYKIEASTSLLYYEDNKSQC